MLSAPQTDVTVGNRRRKKLLQQLTQQGRIGGVPGAGVMSKFITRAAVPRISGRPQMLAELMSRLGPGGAGVPGFLERSAAPGVAVDLPPVNRYGVDNFMHQGLPVPTFDQGQIPPQLLQQQMMDLQGPGYGAALPIDEKPVNMPSPTFAVDEKPTANGWQNIDFNDPTSWHVPTPQTAPQIVNQDFYYNPDDFLLKYRR